MADTIEVTDFPLGYKWNNVYCILTCYTLHCILLFLLYCERITKTVTIRCNTRQMYFVFFVKDPSTIPPFLYNIKRYWSVHNGYKNIPISIYAHFFFLYKYLPFLFNKQFTTHPLTVSSCIQSCLRREISLLSGNFQCESSAGLFRDRSL